METLLSRTIKRDGCWLWTGAKTTAGYGTTSVAGKTRYVHRLAFEHFHRKLKPGEQVCHKCDAPACINPKHLWAGTQKDNIQDALKKGRLSLVGARLMQGWMKHHPESRLCGEHGPGAKLKKSQVQSMRKLWSTGCYTTRDLAKRFGVSQATSWCIVTRKTWK